MSGRGYDTRGIVAVDVTPDVATWVAHLPWGGTMPRAGDLPPVPLPTGIYTIRWDEVVGYYHPTNAPAIAAVETGVTTSVEGRYTLLTLNSDGDGMFDWQEFVAGTDHTNANSFLAITNVCALPAGRVQLGWPSTPDRVYAVFWASNLLENLQEAAAGITSTPPANTYVTTNRAPASAYRVKVTSPQ